MELGSVGDGSSKHNTVSSVGISTTAATPKKEKQPWKLNTEDHYLITFCFCNVDTEAKCVLIHHHINIGKKARKRLLKVYMKQTYTNSSFACTRARSVKVFEDFAEPSWQNHTSTEAADHTGIKQRGRKRECRKHERSE